MHRFVELQRQRVVAMFNRDRARFAEVLVAVLLGEGAEVAANPNAAWDVSLTPSSDTRQVRLEIKCSGADLPKVALDPTYRARASWELPGDKVGIQDGDFKALEKGRHWDVLVLARHEGDAILVGWYFWVLPSAVVPTLERARTFTEAGIAALGAAKCQPAELRAAVLEAAPH